MSVRGAALGVLLLACAPDAKLDTKKAQPSTVESAPVDGAPAAPAPPEFRGPILSLRTKQAVSAGLIPPGKRAAAGTLTALGEGDVLDLDFGCGARAQVSGPALVAVSARSDQGLLVHHGLLRVELPPGAVKPGAACWFASPAWRMELPRAARFALRVDEGGRTQIAVVSGRVTLTTGVDANPEESETTAIEAGGMLDADLTSGSAPRIRSGPATLEAALTLLSAKGSASAGAAPNKLDELLLPGLHAQVARTVSQLERARALDAQHRALVSAHDSQAMILQRQIAEQAAQTFRARRSLEAALSRIEAARLNLPAASAPDPLLSRASELLR